MQNVHPMTGNHLGMGQKGNGILDLVFTQGRIRWLGCWSEARCLLNRVSNLLLTLW